MNQLTERYCFQIAGGAANHANDFDACIQFVLEIFNHEPTYSPNQIDQMLFASDCSVLNIQKILASIHSD